MMTLKTVPATVTSLTALRQPCFMGAVASNHTMEFQIYPSNFGALPTKGRPPQRVRRMSKRKVKRWLAKQLKAAWESSKIDLKAV